ncbi:MAG: lipopolysaccharide heptosyltransferase II [Candidatus Omnitrophica bacterium]|nr:lipopolysaccharide heptosyltransferase II [Candidatus Omnitrophota bacterium]MDD5436092.1 lipopolysaccharide heptosyltransferase II [Candidatus Omnitrophota bacterium]
MKKRILIVNVNWIGDTLFSTPFIRAVRDAYPDSYIACLLHPRCVEMLELNPRLDEIIIYDEEGVHKGLFGKLALIASLRKKRFDTAFLLHGSFTKAFIAFLAGIKERVGYPTKKRQMLLTKVVEAPSEELHKVEYFLNIARAYGLAPKSVSYEFFIDDSHKRFIAGLLRESGVSEGDRIVVLCPGGNWDPKRWPKENFAALADTLAKEYGVRIVISGARKDLRLAEEIRGMMKAKPIIIAGRMTLKELGALFLHAGLVIANDSGPMHLAVAMKARTIALFGPTSPAITGPYGEGRYKVISKNDTCDIPCYDVTCRDNRCMAAIKVEDVLKEAKEALMTNCRAAR